MRLRHPQSQAGFTLVDVMMGATILVVGFIGLIAAVSLGSEMLDTAHKQQIAAQIIDGEIEDLRSSWWSYVSGSLTPATVTVSSSGTLSGDTGYFILNANTDLRNAAKGFTCKREIFAVGGQSNFVKVVVTVTWTSLTGRQTLSRSSEAYFGKNGLRLSYQKS